MIALGAILAFWVYCGAMSVVLREEHPLFQGYLFRAGSVAVFVALLCACAATLVPAGHPLFTMPAFVLVVFIGVFLGFKYWSYLLREFIDGAHAAAVGTDHMKVQKTYDRAEKAEHEGRLDEALELYREEAGADGKDPEPLRRIGELHLRAGREEEAIVCFKAALPLVESPEARTTLACRVADLMDRAGRGAEARDVLEPLARELAGTRFETFLRARLDGRRA